MTVEELTNEADTLIKNSASTLSKLSEAASKQPYYRWNNMWSRQVQDLVKISSSPASQDAWLIFSRFSTRCSANGFVQATGHLGRF